jgi:hypothetical protein
MDPHLDAQIPDLPRIVEIYNGAGPGRGRARGGRASIALPSVARGAGRLENIDAPGRGVIGDPQFAKPNLGAKA